MTERVEMLTVAEAARELRVSRTTIYELMRSGQIRRTKVGRRRLVKRRELERFIERNTDR
jgi:excisionase family DNA binding protein